MSTVVEPTASDFDDGMKSVLGKSFAILDAVTDGGELTLAQISSRTGVPKSTAYRLAKRLCEWGALDERNGKFRIGIRIFEMSRSITGLKSLRELALPFMQDLYEKTHQVVHLGVRIGREVLYVEKISGHRSVSVPTEVGGRRPLHCTALGKALLAHATDDVVDDVLADALARNTGYTVTTPRLVREQLASIRSTGFATEHEETHLGIGCVASPIRLPNGKAVAAISLTMPSHQFRPSTLGPEVRATATALSKVVGSAGVRSPLIAVLSSGDAG